MARQNGAKASMDGYTARMKRLQILIAATALAVSLSAAAQWQWIDKDGRKVFSDRPPSTDVPERNILKQPGMRARQADAPAPDAAPATAGAASTGGRSAGVDKELAEKQKQASDAEAAKRRLEEERIARAQADNCARARQAKSVLDAGQRIAHVNAKGEREFLDDAGRAAEAQRLQAVIDQDCK